MNVTEEIKTPVVRIDKSLNKYDEVIFNFLF